MGDLENPYDYTSVGINPPFLPECLASPLSHITPVDEFLGSRSRGGGS